MVDSERFNGVDVGEQVRDGCVDGVSPALSVVAHELHLVGLFTVEGVATAGASVPV